jgi:alpha-L-fucosidase
MWFDGEWETTWTHKHGLRTLWSLCRALDPSMLVNNRVDVHRAGMGGFSQAEEALGDFHTPEQEIPPAACPASGLGVVHDDERPLGLQRRRPNWKSTTSCCAT